MLVDHRPGGNTIIGSEALVRSQPDGCTLMAMVMTHVIIPQLFATPCGPINDFAPVATLVSTEQLLVLNRQYSGDARYQGKAGLPRK